MHRFSLFFLIISFIFSHQFDNSYMGAIPSFTKTPDPGKVSIYELYEVQKATKAYDDNGNTTSIAKWESTNQGIKIDYFGENGAGISFSYHNKDIKSDLVNSDFDETDVGIYYLWNNVKDGVDLHDNTFNITRIKTGVYYRNNQLDVNGLEGAEYSAQFARFAIDVIVSDKLIWSNLIDKNIKDDDDVSYEYIKSRLIYDISDNISTAVSFVKSKIGRISIAGVTVQEPWESILKIHAAYQLKDKQLGNLNFNLKIAPYFTHSIDGERFFKTETFGIEFLTFFR